MDTSTLLPAGSDPVDRLAAPILCLCRKPHPCPDHGHWARPVDEQLALLDSHQVQSCTCGPGRQIHGCHVHGPQPREHAVLCSYCSGVTMNLNGICNKCMGITW